MATVLPARIEDLSPFLKEKCSLFVLLASEARVGVILRRGPSKWWRVSLWNTKTDQIEGGQWFHGSFYETRCDISPDGNLLLYFAGKYSPWEENRGYGSTYSAVSRPPYLTALSLWPNSGTWGGGGVFLDNQTVVLHQGTQHHPDHPPGPLKVLAHDSVPHKHPHARDGWCGAETSPPAKYFSPYRKSTGKVTLERTMYGFNCGCSYPKSGGSLHTLSRASGEPIAAFQAYWADFDLDGVLVASAGGGLFRGVVPRRNGPLLWHQIAALAEERFSPLPAPNWAEKWETQRSNKRRRKREG